MIKANISRKLHFHIGIVHEIYFKKIYNVKELKKIMNDENKIFQLYTITIRNFPNSIFIDIIKIDLRKIFKQIIS